MWDVTENFSKKWALHGAGLWHLAAAKSLQNEMTELVLLTFDLKLQIPVKGEGLFPDWRGALMAVPAGMPFLRGCCSVQAFEKQGRKTGERAGKASGAERHFAGWGTGR